MTHIMPIRVSNGDIQPVHPAARAPVFQRTLGCLSHLIPGRAPRPVVANTAPSVRQSVPTSTRKSVIAANSIPVVPCAPTRALVRFPVRANEQVFAAKYTGHVNTDFQPHGQGLLIGHVKFAGSLRAFAFKGTFKNATPNGAGMFTVPSNKKIKANFLGSEVTDAQTQLDPLTHKLMQQVFKDPVMLGYPIAAKNASENSTSNHASFSASQKNNNAHRLTKSHGLANGFNGLTGRFFFSALETIAEEGSVEGTERNVLSDGAQSRESKVSTKNNELKAGKSRLSI